MGQKSSTNRKDSSKILTKVVKIRPPPDDDECRFNDPFFVIPKDSIRVVLREFNKNQLAIIGQVSRRWRAAAYDPYLYVIFLTKSSQSLLINLKVGIHFLCWLITLKHLLTEDFWGKIIIIRKYWINLLGTYLINPIEEIGILHCAPRWQISLWRYLWLVNF